MPIFEVKQIVPGRSNVSLNIITPSEYCYASCFYKISLSATAKQDINISSNEATTVINDLSPGITYQVSIVLACDGGDIGDPYEDTFTTDPNPDPDPGTTFCSLCFAGGAVGIFVLILITIPAAVVIICIYSKKRKPNVSIQTV